MNFCFLCLTSVQTSPLSSKSVWTEVSPVSVTTWPSSSARLQVTLPPALHLIGKPLTPVLFICFTAIICIWNMEKSYQIPTYVIAAGDIIILSLEFGDLRVTLWTNFNNAGLSLASLAWQLLHSAHVKRGTSYSSTQNNPYVSCIRAAAVPAVLNRPSSRLPSNIKTFIQFHSCDITVFNLYFIQWF